MTREEIINALQDDKTMPFIQPDQLANIVDFVSENYKPSLPEGLEDEVKRYYSENFAYISSDQPTLSILTNIARHFAEWGAKQVKSND